MTLWKTSSGFVGGAWFAPFGFNKAIADPDTGAMLDADEMFDQGLVLCGTVDTIKRQLETMRARLPVNWVFAWMYNGVLENDPMCRKNVYLGGWMVLPVCLASHLHWNPWLLALPPAPFICTEHSPCSPHGVLTQGFSSHSPRSFLIFTDGSPSDLKTKSLKNREIGHSLALF